MAQSSDMKTLWGRAQRGWPPGFPLVQAPNGPLLVAAGGWIVAAFTEGSAENHARGTFYAGLSAWAWLELIDGANVVRRSLGAAGLVYVVTKVADAL